MTKVNANGLIKSLRQIIHPTASIAADYIEGIVAENKELKAQLDQDFLIKTLAEIRGATGVGAVPMLTELAAAISAKFNAQWQQGYEAAKRGDPPF